MDFDFDYLINTEVFHKSFGKGIVSEVENKSDTIYLTVQFEEKQSKFVFPECFGKYLFSSDERINVATDDWNKVKQATSTVSNSAQNERKTERTSAIGSAPEKAPKGGWYRWYEEHYPTHVILQTEKFMYAAHRESAEVLGTVMDYKIHYRLEDGEAYTGGPDLNIIAAKFQHLNLSYIAISEGEIEDKFDGRNPFV